MPETFDQELKSIDPVQERQKFVDGLVSKLEDESLDVKKDALSLLFAHSVSDAFTIGDRLGVSKEDQLASLLTVGRKQNPDELTSHVIRAVTNNQDFLSDEHKELLEDADLLLGYPKTDIKMSKELRDLIKEYYLPFLAQKRFQETPELRGESLGAKLAYDTFEVRQSLREQTYPFSTISDYILEKTGKEIEWEGGHGMPEWEVKKRFEKLGLDYDEAVSSEAIKTKVPLKEVYEVRKNEAMRELKKEIKESLIRRGFKEDDFEILEGEEGRFKVVDRREIESSIVESDKVFEVGSFERKEINVEMYRRVDDFHEISGKLSFRGELDNEEDVLNIDGFEVFESKNEIRDITKISDKLYYITSGGNENSYVTSHDNNFRSRDYKEVKSLKTVGDKIAFVAVLSDGSQIANVGGEETVPYTFVNPIKDSNSKAIITARKQNTQWTVIYDGVESKGYRRTAREKNIDGKLIFWGNVGEDQWVINYDGVELGQYKFPITVHPSEILEIDGKIAFIEILDNGNDVVNYDGNKSEEYETIDHLKIVNNKLAFACKLFDDIYTVNYDGQESKAYKKITSIESINNKLAFVAKLDNGEYVINYDGQEFSPYQDIRDLKNVGDKFTFIEILTLGPAKYERVVCNGRNYGVYFSVRHLIDLEGKLAFIAEKGDGKKIINYDNKEIPGLEFDKVNIFKYNKDTGLLFISGQIGKKLVTYTKYLNADKELQLNTEEDTKLDLLNLVKNPDEMYEEDHILFRSLNAKEKLSHSHKFATNLTKLIGEDPAIFFDDIRSKSEKFPEWRIMQIVDRLFPEIKIKKEKEEKERKRKSFMSSLGFGRGGDRESFDDENISDSFFNDSDYMELNDGDPKQEGKDMGIEFRTEVQGMLSTNINISNTGGSRWSRLEFPVSQEIDGPTEEITATINVGNKCEVLLPFFTDSKVITSRIKVLDENNKEINHTFEINPLGQVKVKADRPMSQVLYSQEKPLITPAPDDINDEEYRVYKEQFESRYGKTVVEKILDLPPELNQFIQSIESLSPIEKLISIEEYVQQICHYDFDNKKMQSLKRGKSNDERLALMQIRMDEIYSEEPEIKGKMFAGVCADFALLTTALLRKAGFPSGIISGLKIDGKKALSSQAHGLSFVTWPSSDGKNNIFTIDGTPGSHNPNEDIFLSGIRSKSLKDRIKEKQKDIDVLTKDAEKRLAEIEAMLEEYDLVKIKGLSNGELEKVLNIILKHKVKRNHLHTIESILNTKYSPINIAEIDLDDISNTVSATRLIESEIRREKGVNKKDISPDIDSGKKLFETISEFVSRYSNRENNAEVVNLAISKIEKIFKISEQFLDPIEAKAAFAIINYLKAKNLK